MSTIKQVAELAGVSFKTVSRVINKNGNIRKETRERVESAIKKLGYIPDITARTMRTGQSQVIGFITDQIAITPYAVDVIQGAQESAWKHNKMLLVVNTFGRPELDVRSIKMMLERRVEGVIYAAMYHRHIDLPDSLRESKAVLVNCITKGNALPSVVPDEYLGGKEATEILLKKGHRRIAFINLPDDSVAAQGRLKGYKAALKNHKIEFNPDWVKSGLIRHGLEEDNVSYEVALEILSGAAPPTAIFCGNDRIAMRVYDAIRKMGLKIPEDVAVIGFDNLEVIARNLSPGLSSMALPHREMGQWAVNTLLNYSKIKNSGEEHIKIRCPYIVRGSA
ncbi:MAG: LacI family DNA-binding transcriptional regulator [Fidelibacterota bacterium]